jgi:hypothetical protein
MNNKLVNLIYMQAIQPKLTENNHTLSYFQDYGIAAAAFGLCYFERGASLVELPRSALNCRGTSPQLNIFTVQGRFQTIRNGEKIRPIGASSVLTPY